MKYDSALQMFVQAPAPVNTAMLEFLRWLAEQGQLEHEVVSQPTGEFAELLYGADAADEFAGVGSD